MGLYIDGSTLRLSSDLTGLLLQLNDSPGIAIPGGHLAANIRNDYTGCSVDIHVPGFKMISFSLDWRLRQWNNPAYAVIEGKYD